MANTTSENSDGGKKITELKVVELRSELEKRGLDKTGIKAVLLERLEKALESEGKVPADYLFDETELKSKKSAGRLSKGSLEKETKDEEGEEEEEDTNQGLATDQPLSQNDSEEMKKELAVENSDKMDIEPSVDVETEVQNTINNEVQTSPDKPIKPNEDNVDLKEDTNSQIKTDPVPTDPPALPPQSSSSSSSSADVKTKEEDKQNDADKSTVASTQDDSAPTSLNEAKEEEEETQNAVCDVLPPTPTSVPCVAPLTLKDTINMDTSTAQQSEENESLIVHVDDTQNDLDADLLTSQANGLKSREAAKEKAISKTEGKQSDVNSSPPEVGSESSGVGGGEGGGGTEEGDANKGNMDGKTEKKADEKKDDKDGKLKSSSVSKLKIIKNVKGGNQNSRNLWITGLSSNTQAAELKEIFSQYGKVVAVKVMTNARTPGTQCYVFLTMSTPEEASKCIQHLDKTEVHGKKISVERAKKDLAQTIKKTGTKSGEKTVVKKDSIGQNIRNLWVSGLSSNTRATDLKRLFSKYGKVIDAKVVTNVRSPGARCYGFLTMSSLEEANKCIQHLNQTELHGRMISVERAKNDPVSQTAKKLETKPGEKKTEKPEVKKEEKKEGDKKDVEKKGVKKDVKKNELKKDEKDKKPIGKRDDKRHSSGGSHRKTLDKSRVVVMDKSKGEPVISVKRGNKESGGEKKIPASKEKPSTTTTTTTTKPKPSESATEKIKDKNKESKKDILSFNHIRVSKAERERERLRQSERRLREKERKHLQELDRARAIQRDIQRRQQEEAIRLDRVKERLRLDREKLEREKFERERLRMERERIREEQRRVEMLRIEEQQRRAMKRSYEKSHIQESFWDEPKKPNLNPPSNRFHHTINNEPRAYERRVERYDRRDGRTIDTAVSGRFEERKDRDLARRDIGHVRDIRDDRHPDERSHPDNRFDRREVGPNRERPSDRNHENDRRDLGADRRNISAHDRLGRVRNSPAISPPAPDQQPTWGSGLVRKVDNWSHPHGNMNTSVNRPNERWINSNMVSNHDRGSSNSVGFVGGGNSGCGPGGMVQNMRPGNIFVNSQNQSSAMGVGSSGSMGGRVQEPRFDAYKHMQIY